MASVTFDLSGRVALVTGALGDMGHTIAIALAEAGADIALLDRCEVSQLAGIENEVRALGRRVFSVKADLNDVTGLPHVVEHVEAALGPIGILVNNAGVNQVEPAFDVTPETWDRLMSVNLRAPFFFSTAVAKGMVERRSGKIINIASEAGLYGLPEHAAYGTSKGALVTLTKILAVEWGASNVQVNAVCPGATWTSMTRPAMEDPETRATILSRGVAGRICDPKEIAAAVVYLASSAADMVLGHALSVDGGSTAK